MPTQSQPWAPSGSSSPTIRGRATEKRKKKNGNEFLGAAAAAPWRPDKIGRTVADYLVQHAAEAQYLSISLVGKGVLCGRGNGVPLLALGFEGHHEMRIALAQANATGVLVNQHAGWMPTRQLCASTPAPC